MEELIKNFEYWYTNFAKKECDKFHICFLIIHDVYKYQSMEGIKGALRTIKSDKSMIKTLEKLLSEINKFNKIPKYSRKPSDFGIMEFEIDFYDMILDFDDLGDIKCLTSESRVLQWFKNAKVESRNEKIDNIIA